MIQINTHRVLRLGYLLLDSTKVVRVLVRPVLVFNTFRELCKAAMDGSGMSYLGDEQIQDLVLDMSQENLKSGGFKLAMNGKVQTPMFKGHDKLVCAKQVYYIQDKKKLPWDSRKQIVKLMEELKCNVWARALLSMSYAYIDRFIAEKKNSDPVPVIPSLRFVHCGLAVEQGGRQDAYLLEELIDIHKDKGGYKKYINNDSPDPLPYFQQDDLKVSDFVSSTQHMQYWLTGKLAFVTDYQGTLSC